MPNRTLTFLYEGLDGMIFIHQGDESDFEAERASE